MFISPLGNHIVRDELEMIRILYSHMTNCILRVRVSDNGFGSCGKFHNERSHDIHHMPPGESLENSVTTSPYCNFE